MPRQFACMIRVAITGLLSVAGCANPPTAQPHGTASPASTAGQTQVMLALPPPSNPDAAAERDLAQGIELYDLGDFAGAIRKLSGSPEIASASIPVRIRALKYLAFSYCVTNRAALCRLQFEKALKLNPKFDLEPAEKGHPQWGPVFDRVKKAQQASQRR